MPTQVQTARNAHDFGLMSQIPDADAVLLSFRKRRSSPACYPCSKRKVRCRGGRPCDACKARGHPEICQEEDARKQKPHRAPVRKIDRSMPSINQNGHSPQSPPSQSVSSAPTLLPPDTYAEPTVGTFSAVNFVRERLSRAYKSLNHDIHPSIGLGNTDNSPLAVAPLSVMSPQLLRPPRRDEVLHYYPSFRNNVIVLYAFAPDIAALDTQIHNILQDSSNVQPQHMAVALASLALGAQFAEVIGRPRREISRDLISRSTAYLQQANYIFQPTLEVVQTLLMVGMALQNCGQSDGAWALLGLNYRLAQTLGLHLLDPSDGQGAMLWTALIWQDASVSLRYDRPPLSYNMGIADVDQGYDLSYYQAIRSNCLLGIDMLKTPSNQRTDIRYISRSVDSLDDMLARCCTHLQPHNQVRNFEQRLQRYALKFHSSLVRAEICRPMFSAPDPNHDHIVGQVRQRGLNALIANIEAYLEICTFSNVPLRLWSMIQGAVSCALVLALIGEQASHAPIQPLLLKLVDALKIDTGSQDPTSSLPIELLQGVCLMRVKAARLLDSIISDTSGPQPSSRGEPPTTCQGTLDATDLTWPTDLSLFDQAFADSIMTFGLDQGTYTDGAFQD